MVRSTDPALRSFCIDHTVKMKIDREETKQ
jgi:hypothetical protein